MEEEIKKVRSDVKTFKAISAIVDQEGGKILVASLIKDVANGVDTILSLYKAPELELRSAVAKLKADLALLRVLKRAPKNKKLAEVELASLLEDAPIEE